MQNPSHMPSDNAPNAPGKQWTAAQHSKGWRLELMALSGFCVSGVIFVISGILNGDFLTVLGSLVWIISCICWMIPYKKYLA